MTNTPSSERNPNDQSTPRPAEVAPANDRPAAAPVKSPTEAPPIKT